MTERAAERALNAIDVAQPIQDGLASQAKDLTQRWDTWFAHPVELDAARQLVLDNRAYLTGVPQQVSATNAQLLEIMMVQDFQDPTGQVIRKMLQVIKDMDVQLLIHNAQPEKRPAINHGLLREPQTVSGLPDVVDDQS